MNATVTKHRYGSVDSVAVSGRLTAAEAPLVRTAVLDVLAKGEGRLVLDLTRLDFCDSSGLSVLLSALKAARTRGGNVSLAGVTPPVRALIELTQLHRIFEIFDEPEAAAVRMGWTATPPAGSAAS